MCFILPTLVPWYYWGETFVNSLYVCAFLRYAMVLNCTWLVNSAAHIYGYRPYDKNIEPRENVLVSVGAVGKSLILSMTIYLGTCYLGCLSRSQGNQNDLFYEYCVVQFFHYKTGGWGGISGNS